MYRAAMAGEDGVSKGMSGHQSARMGKDEWLTPPEIIRALGTFDLDPCAAVNQPWPTARVHYTLLDSGLLQPWFGRVWLNPPYGLQAATWLARLVQHGDGIALIPARTETRMFFTYVWPVADALLFLAGRPHFYHADGSRARGNSGAPVVLIAYGQANARALRESGITGQYIELRTIPALFGIGLEVTA